MLKDVRAVCAGAGTCVIAAILFGLLATVPLNAQTGNDSTAAAKADTTRRAGTAPSTPASSSADHMPRAPQASATRLTGAISIDGRLDEAIWQSAPAVTELHQIEPGQGVPASLRTEVRIVYDDESIYVGARMYDDKPEAIVRRLARRDAETGSDHILVMFDPYHNHTGDASFSLSAAGGRWDGGNGDVSWDPVWEGKALVDSLGWTAEMRIPFSQLRFRPGSKDPWGLQVQRYVNHLNETTVWSWWRSDESGGPSRWGHLNGMENPSRVLGRLELLPYVVTQAQLRSEVDANNPFVAKREGTFRVGTDLKYQVTSNLTLSATINPDFGQAEVDPAVVNLSAFETFFDEKREFFIEGRDKFSFGSLWCFTCSNVSSLSMSFTRRIGRPPQAAGLAFGPGRFVDVPEATTILGAAKLTGRTAKGWNIGIMDAATAREWADIREGTTDLKQEVEPFTNYFVSRISRELESGNLRVGGIATSVYRSFEDDDVANRLNRHAEGVGVDTEYWWANRRYHLIAQAAITNISGEPTAILRAQQSSARFFQRPDRDHGSNGLFSDAYDPTMTSMRGYGSYLRMAKEGGSWRWETSANIRSPGFENNDIAALSRADYIWLHGNINRRWTQPTKHYRYLNFTFGGQQQYNYDGDLTGRQVHGSAFYQAPFYWEFSVYGHHRPSVMDERRTRGGPVVALPADHYIGPYIASNRSKRVYFEFFPSYYWSDEGGRALSLGAGVTVQPSSNVSIRVGPNYEDSRETSQFVTAVDDATAQNFYGRRYVFSDLDQKSLSMETRLNVTFSPTMSLQLFAQPFISSNDFAKWKEYARPRAVEKLIYGEDVGTVTVIPGAERDTIAIDPDGSGPAATFRFNNPDFTLRSLRGNAVFRWEYIPGSTLFLVWTQDRASVMNVGELDFPRDRRALFTSPANHVFLAKVNYWLPI